jgi:nucleoside-diphosphate-sugar epimerase
VLRIGVTGAFGFLGANFISALLQRLPETEITAFASRTRANPVFSSDTVRIRDLNILHPAAMAEKFQGLDAVAHFAGRVDYRRQMRREVWEIDVLGAKKVFDAVLKANVAKLLYVSSICALGAGRQSNEHEAASMATSIASPEASPAGSIPSSLALPPSAQLRRADENSIPYDDPNWPISFTSSSEALAAVDASEAGDFSFIKSMDVAYFDAKLAAWELAKRYCNEKGLPIITIFPGTAVGPGDLNNGISKLVNSVWEGKLRFAPSGATAFMDSRDLGRGALLSLLEGKIGESYVIAGRDEHNLSYKKFMEMVAGIAQKESRLKPSSIHAIPAGPAILAASLIERILPKSSLSKALILSGSVRNLCTSAKAQRELGYEPRADLAESIMACRAFQRG